MGNWPASVIAHRLWRLLLFDEVVVASARPDEAFTWITVVTKGISEDVFDQHLKLTEAGEALFRVAGGSG